MLYDHCEAVGYAVWPEIKILFLQLLKGALAELPVIFYPLYGRFQKGASDSIHNILVISELGSAKLRLLSIFSSGFQAVSGCMPQCSGRFGMRSGSYAGCRSHPGTEIFIAGSNLSFKKTNLNTIKPAIMLDNLLNVVKQYAGEAIVNNPAVPNEKNEEVITEASSSIAGGLQGLLSQGGGLKDVLKIFGGQDAVENSNVTNQISGGVVQNLMDKFGLDSRSAGSIAGSLVPSVLSSLVQKTNDTGDSSFDIQGLFNSLSGGRTSGLNLQDMLSKVKSGALDLDGDGDTDLQDLLSLFNKGGGSGLMDKVKGLFGS